MVSKIFRKSHFLVRKISDSIKETLDQFMVQIFRNQLCYICVWMSTRCFFLSRNVCFFPCLPLPFPATTWCLLMQHIPMAKVDNSQLAIARGLLRLYNLCNACMRREGAFPSAPTLSHSVTGEAVIESLSYGPFACHYK